MNNRYICKGKRKDNNEWVEGYYVCNGEHCYIFSGKLGIINKNFNWVRYEVIPETVGQCTGKTDRKYKLIFDVDLLRFTNSDNEQSIYKVFYSDDYGGWAIQEVGCGGIDDMANWETNREHFELIGSAHDNPELLEVEK